MTNQEKEVMLSIIEALKEIEYAITTGVHGYNFTRRIHTAIDNAENTVRKMKGE